MVQPLLPNFLNGFNCTVYTYGQTGSGKTYTMFGPTIANKHRKEQERPKIVHRNRFSSVEPATVPTKSIGQERKTLPDMSPNMIQTLEMISQQEDSGIIPKSLNFIFAHLQSGFNLSCSFIQVYNDKVFDLLNSDEIHKQLQVREDKVLGIHVEGLQEFQIQSKYDALHLMQQGEANRSTRATVMNQNSSRSHSIFQLKFERIEGQRLFRSKLNLCDLSGSEKINKQEEIAAGHMSELKNINLSLTTLGKVI